MLFFFFFFCTPLFIAEAGGGSLGQGSTLGTGRLPGGGVGVIPGTASGTGVGPRVGDGFGTSGGPGVGTGVGPGFGGGAGTGVGPGFGGGAGTGVGSNTPGLGKSEGDNSSLLSEGKKLKCLKIKDIFLLFDLISNDDKMLFKSIFHFKVSVLINVS